MRVFLAAIFLAICIACVNVHHVVAQPETVWRQICCQGYRDRDMVVLGDGGSVVVGDNGGDILVVKIDSEGRKVWERIYDHDDYDTADSIIDDRDGGLLILGDTYGSRPGGLWAIRIDGQGNQVWERIFPEVQHVGPRRAFVEAEGFVFVTYLYDVTTDVVSMIFFGVDRDGQRRYTVVGPELHGGLKDIIETAEGGYVAVGGSNAFGDRTSLYFFKVNSSGSLVWEKILRGDDIRTGPTISIVGDGEGGYLIAAMTWHDLNKVRIAYSYNRSSNGWVVENTWRFEPADRGVYVVKINCDGDVEWDRCYRENRTETVRKVVRTMGGGFVIAGENASKDDGSYDVYLLKLGRDGDVAWDKTYDLGGSDYVFPVVEASADCFVLAGTTYGLDSGVHSVWVSKLYMVPPSPIIKIHPILVVLGESYAISWSEVAGADSYLVQEDTDPSFPFNKTVYSGTGTYVNLTKSTEGTFYYRVRALKGPLQSAWSDHGTVQIRSQPEPPPSRPTAPTVRAIQSPVRVDEVFAVSWEAVPGADRYIAQEDADPGFPSNLTVYDGIDTSFTVRKSVKGRFYYRVKVAKGSLWSEWSEVEYVKIEPSAFPHPGAKRWVLVTVVVVFLGLGVLFVGRRMRR